MTARNLVFLLPQLPLKLPLILGLSFALSGCDTSKAETGPNLPAATGEQAPKRVEIPTPAKAIAGEDAFETVNHRWLGSVKAKHHVELAPGMTGVIASIAVEEGDTVKAGDQVFRIEGSEVKLAVSQAQAALAAAELHEETGVAIAAERLVRHGARQCMATMISHHAELYSVELDAEELAVFEARVGQRFGEHDSERTYVEVRSVGEILAASDVDWTHVGMILSVLVG